MALPFFGIRMKTNLFQPAEFSKFAGILSDQGHEFEQILGDSEGQGSCSPWGHKESDRTEQLNNNNKTILPKLTFGVNIIIISGDFL